MCSIFANFSKQEKNGCPPCPVSKRKNSFTEFPWNLNCAVLWGDSTTNFQKSWAWKFWSQKGRFCSILAQYVIISVLWYHSDMISQRYDITVMKYHSHTIFLHELCWCPSRLWNPLSQQNWCRGLLTETGISKQNTCTTCTCISTSIVMRDCFIVILLPHKLIWTTYKTFQLKVYCERLGCIMRQWLWKKEEKSE